MNGPSTSRTGPTVPAVVRNHRRSFMPGELLRESGFDRARGRTVDRVHRNTPLALDATGARQRIVPIVFETHEDVDAVAGDAVPRVVREAEPVVHFPSGERDPAEGGNVEHRPDVDASRIDG